MLWLTIDSMAQLFSKARSTINTHKWRWKREVLGPHRVLPIEVWHFPETDIRQDLLQKAESDAGHRDGQAEDFPGRDAVMVEERVREDNQHGNERHQR